MAIPEVPRDLREQITALALAATKAGDADVGVGVAVADRLRAAADTIEHSAMRTARHDEMTWESIGFALGCSPGAARERLTRLQARISEAAR